jgi:hypothetical protein
MTQLPLLPPKPVQTLREFVRTRLDGYGARQLVREARRRRANGHARRRRARAVQEPLQLDDHV